MQKQRKCKCGFSACKQCSRLKLVFMIKHQFKKQTPYNPVWYSFLKEETKSLQEQINYMLKRAKDSNYQQQTNCIIIYDNQTNKTLLKTTI